MAEQWLSIVEYARNNQLSDMTVRRRIKNGKLHAVLKEGKYFIPAPPKERPSVDRDTAVSRNPQGEADTRLARPSASMMVVKGHPDAASTFALSHTARAAAQTTATSHLETPTAAAPRPVVPPVVQEAQMNLRENVGGVLPQSLTRPLSQAEASWVDTKALLAFCEASMRKIGETERRTVERFKAKLEAVEATLVARDMEVKALRQQVEDLQLLVKILEKKS